MFWSELGGEGRTVAIPASVPIKGHSIVETVFIWEVAAAIGVM